MTQAWNLSQLGNKVNTSGQLDAANGLSGIVPLANGGTNSATLTATAGGVLYTDGSKVANVGAGTSGQILKSNGASPPTWTSAASASYITSTFTKSATFIPHSGSTAMWIFVLGTNGGKSTNACGGVGGAGYSEKYIASPTGTYPIVIGAGGTNSPGTAGGTTTVSTISVTGSGAVTGNAGSSGGVATGGDFNATGGTGGTGAALANTTSGTGGGGAAGSRAGNGFNGGNGTSGTGGSAGGGGGTGGAGQSVTNAGSFVSGAAGITATSVSGSAIAMPVTYVIFSFANASAGAQISGSNPLGGSGANASFTTELDLDTLLIGGGGAGGCYFALTGGGGTGTVIIIEKIG